MQAETVEWGCELRCWFCSGAAAHAAADSGRDQRAAGVPLLPAHLLLLLLAQAALPGQARAVGHSVRVRVLPPTVPHQELAHHAQEPAAPRLQRHAKAAAEDVGAALCAGAGAAPPVRPRRRWRPPGAAARPAMTGLALNANPATRARVQYYGQCQNDAAKAASLRFIVL